MSLPRSSGEGPVRSRRDSSRGAGATEHDISSRMGSCCPTHAPGPHRAGSCRAAGPCTICTVAVAPLLVLAMSRLAERCSRCSARAVAVGDCRQHGPCRHCGDGTASASLGLSRTVPEERHRAQGAQGGAAPLTTRSWSGDDAPADPRNSARGAGARGPGGGDGLSSRGLGCEGRLVPYGILITES